MQNRIADRMLLTRIGSSAATYRQIPFVSCGTSSARFSSRTGPSPENGLHFFEDIKGICEGDRTLETGDGPKIGL
jgi:hypothetical protein